MEEGPVVKIAEGELRGAVDKDINNEPFYSFTGIPYAEPPLGELRFKAPVPAASWTGIKDVTKEADACFHISEILPEVNQGSEDCLYLNVYTRSLPQKNQPLKPVMFYIHGGGFVFLSSTRRLFGPEVLITEDVVYVSVNYRHGVLGFLSLKDTSLGVPGNAGLKDQTLALKWVQRNIKSFNGDPDNVTIFGHSAGAASVHYQILSPTAKGLFHKAILISGSSLNPWPYSDEDANRFAKNLGVETDDEEELLDALRNVTVEELVVAQNKFIAEKKTILRMYGPVIEKPNATAFLTEDPIKILKSGKYNKVPTMFGYADNEGFAEMAFKNGAPVVYQEYIPPQMGLEKGSADWKIVGEKLRDFYDAEKYRSNKYLIATDGLFLAGIMAALYNHVKSSGVPSYLYRVSLVCNLNMSVVLLGMKDLPSPSHGDDIGFLFPVGEAKVGKIEEMARKRYVKLLTNYAKYGNPTPSESELNIIWRPVEVDKVHFLDFNKDLTVGTDPESERMEFWRGLYRLSPNTKDFL